MKNLPDHIDELCDALKNTGHSDLVITSIDSMFESATLDAKKHCVRIAETCSIPFPKMPWSQSIVRTAFFDPDSISTSEFSLKIFMN